jgi:hypothetical protein
VDILNGIVSFGIGQRSSNSIIFLFSCLYGQLDLAKEMYGLGGINVHSNNESAFLLCL